MTVTSVYVTRNEDNVSSKINNFTDNVKKQKLWAAVFMSIGQFQIVKAQHKRVTNEVLSDGKSANSARFQASATV
jgi:hypothetical protein